MKGVLKEIMWTLLLALICLPVFVFLMLIAKELGISNIGYHGKKLFTVAPSLALFWAIFMRIWWRGFRVQAKKD